MKFNLEDLENKLTQSMAGVRSGSDLEMLKRDWLSKEGTLKTLFKELKDVDPSEKPQVAAKLNEFKNKIEDFVETKQKEFGRKSIASNLQEQFFDLSLPGKQIGYGSIHPVRAVDRKLAAILKPFGFKIVPGPEVETEYYCFDALNIPKHHPARDMQDTFYTDTGHVLRTHTTSIQARELEKKKLPVKVAAFGRVYRNETEDPTHQAMFHQFELVWLEKGLTLAHLTGLITHILKQLYGQKRKVRFVPKYYPYTEPSIGPQIDCLFCKGKGCNACVGCGWSTIAGAGMIHRKVLEEFGYDPKEISGFAFGMGSTKLATQFFKIPTMKAIYDNDLRVLRSLA